MWFEMSKHKPFKHSSVKYDPIVALFSEPVWGDLFVCFTLQDYEILLIAGITERIERDKYW